MTCLFIENAFCYRRFLIKKLYIFLYTYREIKGASQEELSSVGGITRCKWWVREQEVTGIWWVASQSYSSLTELSQLKKFNNDQFIWIIKTKNMKYGSIIEKKGTFNSLYAIIYNVFIYSVNNITYLLDILLHLLDLMLCSNTVIVI